MQRVWEVERAAGSSVLRAEILDSLGGAERIVAEHLERAVDELRPFQKDIAAELSRYLVTPSGTKFSHTLSDLAGYAGLSELDLEPVAAELTDRRILRSLDTREGVRYEIFHDVLAGAVLGWRTRYQAERALQAERAAARKRHRRLLLAIGAAVVALAAMSVLTVWALSERRHAHAQTVLVHARELDATALARLPNDPELSLLLAREAGRTAPSAQVEEVLRDALRTSRVRWIARTGRKVVSAEFDHSGRFILVATEDGKVQLYRSFRLARILDHGAPLETAHFDRTGKNIVTTGMDGVAKVWRRDGTVIRRVRHGAAITNASFSYDGSLLVTAGGHAAKVWRIHEGGLLAELRTPKPVTGALFSRNGRLVIVWGRDHQVRVFSLATRKVRRTFDQGAVVTDAAPSPNGQMIVTTGVNKLAFVWSLGSGRKLSTLAGHVGQIRRAAFGPQSGMVATASTDGTARLWTLDSQGHVAGVTQLPGHTNPVVDVAFSPDGQFVVTASGDGTARVSTADKGAFRTLLSGDSDVVRTASFSPDGRLVITGSDDGTARVWDAATGKDLLPTATEAPTAPVREARTVDGTIARAEGKDVRLRGPFGTRVLHGHRRPITSVAFSPDGAELVTASQDADARVWDVRTGRLLHRLDAHFGPVADARFSPDGRWIVTAGPITAGLWSAATGDFVTYLRGPKSVLTAASFTADSRTIVTAERDGTVRTYHCDICGTLPELMQLAGARLAATRRTLTPEERRRYLG
jgi:WD40 repeat protein